MKKNGLRRTAWIGLFSMLLPIAAAQAQYVHEAPPPPVVEQHHLAPPGHGFVWVPGYHRWDGRRYVWVEGRWTAPPRPGAYWVPGHWRRTPYGWHWMPGHWR